MRHAARQQDQPERTAPLTDEGRRRAQETAIAVAATRPPFDLVLRNDVPAAKETADQLIRLPDALVKVSAALASDRDHITLADLEPELMAKPNVVAVIGHHPGITRLLRDLTGRDCRTIDRGEAIWVNCWDGQAAVQATFGSRNTAETLRKKIELKMTVSTFLAGFTIPVLVELVKEPQSGFNPQQTVATILLTSAFCLFALAVYMYDELLMPNEYWGPVEKKHQPAMTARSAFAHHYRLNGRPYAYMVRTWNSFFTPAAVCTALGFLALIPGKWPKEHVLEVLLGCALALILSVFAHRRWRPKTKAKLASESPFLAGNPSILEQLQPFRHPA
jgi:phosphohistidine phosphatase SixA